MFAAISLRTGSSDFPQIGVGLFPRLGFGAFPEESRTHGVVPLSRAREPGSGVDASEGRMCDQYQCAVGDDGKSRCQVDELLDL